MMVPATPTVMATSTTSAGHSRMSGVVMVTVDRMTRVNHGTLVEKRWKLILTECGITSTIDEILKIYAKAGIVEDLTVLRRVILTEGLKEKTTEVHTTEDRAGIIKIMTGSETMIRPTVEIPTVVVLTVMTTMFGTIQILTTVILIVLIMSMPQAIIAVVAIRVIVGVVEDQVGAD